MEKLTIVLEEGLTEEHIQEGIKRCTAEWKNIFQEPRNVDYEFFNPFWGRSWDGTPENLKEILLIGLKIKDSRHHYLAVFKYDGIDRFVFCSWTKELYDVTTNIKYLIEPKYARNITEKITKLCKPNDSSEL